MLLCCLVVLFYCGVIKLYRLIGILFNYYFSKVYKFNHL
nr:MAG TPA: hypothetical protein [Caudoviricetes sp.]